VTSELKLDLPPGVKLVRTLRGHTGWIGRIAWSPDGKILASPSGDGTTRLWNPESGRPLRVLKGHEEARARAVFCAAFDVRSRVLASGGTAGRVRLWDLAGGKTPPKLKPHGELVTCVAFDPEGQRMVTADDRGFGGGSIRLWRLEDGKLLSTADIGTTFCIAFDPQGDLLAVGGHLGVILWRTGEDKLVRAPHPDLETRRVFGVAFHPYDRTLVTAGEDGIGVWLHGKGRLLRMIQGHSGWVNQVVFANDGRLLASKAMDSSVRLWRTDTGACVATFPEPTSNGWPPGLAMHPTLPLLATVGSDPGAAPEKSDQVIHIWELDFDVLRGKTRKPAVAYTSAKIVLVGEGGVGKTGLGWRLAHGSFKDQPPTHGQQFWILSQLGKTRADGTQCEGILWDLAGQPDYRLIHALFLDDADVALVLFDPTRADDPLQGVEFWLKQLRPDCQKLLIAARSDLGSPRLTREELEAFCRSHRLHGYIETSALRGDGIEELLKRLQNLIPWNDKPATITTETFKRIKDHVLSLKEEADRKAVLTSPELRERLELSDRTWKFSDDEMLTAVGHLANHGYVTKLTTSKGEPRILLAPELLNNLAASLVLEARRQEKGLGSLEEKRLLSGHYPFPELQKLSAAERDVMLDSAAAMFLEHNVCFRETDPLTSQTYLVFPELINLKKPFIEEAVPLKDGPAYTVAGAVENVYASLVVLLGYTHTFTRTNQWRNQARYEVGDGLVCAFRQEGEAEGELQFVLSYGVNVGAPVRTLFQSLFESFLARRNLTVLRYEPVACSKGHKINRAVVRERAASGFTFCSECGEKVALPRLDEPIQLTRKEEVEVEAQRRVADQRSRFEQAIFRWKSYVTDEKLASPECFISYAWGNAEQERWVEHSLATDLLKAGVSVVLDRWENRRIGASVPRFVERLAKCDRVIVVGTPAYRTKYDNREPMGGGFVVAAEGDLIGKRMTGTEAQKESVLPILLEGTAETSLPYLLQPRVYSDFRDADKYFESAFELILSLYQIPHGDPVAEELRGTLQDDLGRWLSRNLGRYIPRS
jgi:WD40 repeat protein/GTPase SAR1 family protein